MSASAVNSTSHLNEDYKGSSGGCWKRKSSLEKKLIVFTSVLVLALIGVIVALAIASAKEDTVQSVAPRTEEPESTRTEEVTSQQPLKVCLETHCLGSALYFLEHMDLSADPCEDFHQFVCGKWVEENPIPADKGRYGTFDDLRDNLANDCIEALESIEPGKSTSKAVDKAGTFYQTCLKTEILESSTEIQYLTKLLEAVNVSPDYTTLHSNFEAYSTLSSIVKAYGLNFILSFSVGADILDPTQNIIRLDQPSSFGLGYNFLVNFNETSNRVQAYKKYIKDSLELLNDTLTPADMDETVQAILMFEVNMTSMTRDPVSRRNASSWNIPMNMSDLALSVNQIDFLKYVNDILNGTVDLVDEQEVVIVKEAEYFRNVAKLISDTDQRVVSNYLAWRLIQSLGPSLSRRMRDIRFEFDKVNLGIMKDKKIDFRCFDLTNSYFDQVVGRLYIEKIKFKNEYKKEMETMVTNLFQAFRSLVEDNKWMDSETKNKSLEKLQKMVSMMAYPDWTLDDKTLDSFYDMASPTADNFYDNYIDVMGFSVKKSLKKLRMLNNRAEDWISSASIVNAFYSSTLNSITFPAGILQEPFFAHRLKVLNYGAIGYVIGHEITHGFDDSGRQYDGDGSLNNWWTDITLDEYIKRRDCFIDQYSAITDPLSGLSLNGKQTIGENIADNGGIRESYRAYTLSRDEDQRLPGLEEYNDLQLFYISAGSIWCSQFNKEEMINQINQGAHSPGMYRAYVPLANDMGFAEAFQCKKGSKMNPEHRCQIW